jgi:excisionase family DNA binding protein
VDTPAEGLKTGEGGELVNDLWYEVKDVARMLQRTPQRVYQMIERGQMPAQRIGGKLVIPRASFRRWQRQLIADASANCRQKGDGPDAA